MTEHDATPYPKVTPYLFYEDPAAALEWLEKAFGFTERLRMTGEDGRINHAEMSIDDVGVLMLGGPGPEYENPKRSGRLTAMVYVMVDDVDALFERAREAGAVVLMEPTEQDYGDRRCDLVDLEGHMWSFAQQVRAVPPSEWGATTSE